jgi:hypothetical protein
MLGLTLSLDSSVELSYMLAGGGGNDSSPRPVF